MRLLPNLITCARIALTPFIAYSIAGRECSQSLWLVALAGATDGLDGFLARRFGWVSRTGAYLDPIADKALLTAIYVALGLGGLAPLWLVALVVGRDILILGMALFAYLVTSIRDFPPSVWGKISTVIQIGAALVMLSGCAGGWPRTQGVQEVAVFAAAAGTAWSGIHYVWLGVCSWKSARQDRI